MSAPFDEAFLLVQQSPMPSDIIERLEELEKNIDPSESMDFGWLYEAAQLENNEIK